MGHPAFTLFRFEVDVPRPRKKTPDVNFSVKLAQDDMSFLERLKDQLGYAAIADVLRDIVEALRTTFGLPLYQAERLQQDMAARKMNVIQYLQELLARRYEELARDTSPTQQ